MVFRALGNSSKIKTRLGLNFQFRSAIRLNFFLRRLRIEINFALQVHGRHRRPIKTIPHRRKEPEFNWKNVTFSSFTPYHWTPIKLTTRVYNLLLFSLCFATPIPRFKNLRFDVSSSQRGWLGSEKDGALFNKTPFVS